MHNLYPNILEESRSTGTGPMVLRGPAQGTLAIGEVYDNGATITHYRIDHTTQADEWEEGTGVFTDAGGVRGLTRVEVYSSSNADALVDFSYGQKLVRIGGAVIIPTFDEDPAILPNGTTILVAGALKVSDGTEWNAVGGASPVIEVVAAGGAGFPTTWDAATTVAAFNTTSGNYAKAPSGDFADGWKVTIICLGSGALALSGFAGSPPVQQANQVATATHYNGAWYVHAH